MARSLLNEIKQDLIDDSGSVLWSIITGEQLEFPVEVDFLESVLDGYEFECVIVEALNTVKQEEYPTDIRPAGAQTTLDLRLPNLIGSWDANVAYNNEDVVSFGVDFYKLVASNGYINSVSPADDDNWVITTMNTLYVQFPSTLTSDWELHATANYPVYGFFELRVTEPNTSIYRRTWKPVRGLMQFLFSPTHIVPD